VALETLFLDVGGVLAHPNWERVASALRRRGVEVSGVALRAEEARAKLVLDRADHVRASDDDSRGVDLFHLVLGRVGIEPCAATDDALAEVRAYHARHNLWEVVPDEVPAALERVHRMGVPMVVVSNANGTIDEHLDRLGIRRYFVAVLDSLVEGVEKPDRRIFERALERAGARAETTVHVGDLYEIDVVGARAARVEGVLVDPAGLYADADCRRFPTLTAVVEAVEGGEL
jgi:HAD superfamily hydrolase (TIGR01549 family)